MPNAHAPLTDNDRDLVRQLHAAGAARNDIAREIGRSPSTVSKLAKELGLSFDRTKTAVATAAKVNDAKARRAQLQLDLLGDAERLRRQLWEECEYIDHGGKDFNEARWTQPEPSSADKLKLMQAAKLALDGSLRLDQHDGDGSNETVGSLLGALFDNLVSEHGEKPADGDA